MDAVSPVRLAIRGNRDRLVEVLQAAGKPAGVGPDREGWCPVWVPAWIDSGGPAAELSTVLGTAILGVQPDSDDDELWLTAWWDGAEQVELTGGPGAGTAAARLASAFGRHDLADELARTATDRGHRAADRIAAAARLLGVPEGVLIPAGARAVAVYRGAPADAELAAAASAETAGPSWVAEVEGWTLVAPEEVADNSIETAARLSQLLGRRHPVLWIWQDGDRHGYTLFRRGRIVDVHIWRAGWWFLPNDRDVTGDAAAIAAAVGRPAAEVPLRALLRRQDAAGSVLPELADQLGLPDAILAVLTGRTPADTLPGARRPQPTTPWAQARQQLIRPTGHAARVDAWCWLVGATLAGIFAGVMTVLEILVLVTGGAIVHRDVSLVDVVFTGVFGGLTAVMVWIALRQVRRLRGSRSSEG